MMNDEAYNCRVMGTETEDHVHVEIIVHPHELTVDHKYTEKFAILLELL